MDPPVGAPCPEHVKEIRAHRPPGLDTDAIDALAPPYENPVMQVRDKLPELRALEGEGALSAPHTEVEGGDTQAALEVLPCAVVVEPYGQEVHEEAELLDVE